MRHIERETLQGALGLWAGKRTPWRNRTAHNEGNRVTSAVHGVLAHQGFLVRDPAQDYGRMRVYRATAEGAAALGKRLPKKLAALVPESPTAH